MRVLVKNLIFHGVCSFLPRRDNIQYILIPQSTVVSILFITNLSDLQIEKNKFLYFKD